MITNLEAQSSASKGMAPDAGYQRRSLSALNSSCNTVVNGCCTPEAQISNIRKRQRPDPRVFELNGTSQPQPKKQKLNHPTVISHPPSKFWDNLSKIWLTEGALGELGRRISQPATSPPRPRNQPARRPVTRKLLAARKRKRQLTLPASDFLHHCDSGTLKDIQRFARHGGPDLSNLKGVSTTRHPSVIAKADGDAKYLEPIEPVHHTMSSSQSYSRGRKRDLASIRNTGATTNTTNTNTTISSGPYSRNFQQKLIDAGVYPDEYEYPDGRVAPEPENIETINQILTQPRPSLSPSQVPNQKFKEFKRSAAHVSKENKAMKTVVPIIEGKITDDKCVEGDIPFTNLAPLTNDVLTAAKPDLYYGARPEQLRRQVREELSEHIKPSTEDDLPIAPNFFLEVKGPNGTGAVAARQACYDGALGARAIHSLQSYAKDKPAYDNNAYTIMSIYDNGQLKMYTSHLTQPVTPGSRPEYCMTQLNTWGLTGNVNTFRQGVTAYRNARDWTKEQRDEAIERANERANDNQVGTSAVDASFGGVSSFATEASSDQAPGIEALSQESRAWPNKILTPAADLQESESSMDELALDYEHLTKRWRSSKQSPRLQ